MAKIVFIGAGSCVFTRSVVRDLLTLPVSEGATIGLVDINAERLEWARRACQKLIDVGGYRANVVCSTRRRDVLKGADAVITTILKGGVSVWQHDILIPKKYGVDINVGDTRGPSGIFRMLRTLPELLAICRDMEELCPEAILLNYTNPMAMLCHGLQRQSAIRVTGLCHSVQGTAEMLAKWVDVPPAELDYVCAGVNHLAWYLKLEHRGRDLYPLLKRRVAADKALYNREQVRNEMFLALGYYVTESSGHNSEYNAWFRKRPDLIEKYCTHGTNWNPGLHAFIVNSAKQANPKKAFTDWIRSPDWNDPEKRKRRLAYGHEYAAKIINAWMGDALYTFNGNVPNTGLVTNLPPGACVEVPVLASRRRLQAMHVGALPLAVTPLTALTATTEQMAVEGALTGDADLIYQAIAHDPLTSAVLSLAEIRSMVREMFRRNRACLPRFRDADRKLKP